MTKALSIMSRLAPWFIALCPSLLISSGSVAFGQERSVVVKVINGKSGKPIPHQRLLLFGGKSQQLARMKTTTEEVTTGADGTATLRFDPAVTAWVQVFPDFKTGCFDDPNAQEFSLLKAVQIGESTPNNCGGPTVRNARGVFVVYAREATLWEKMNW